MASVSISIGGYWRRKALDGTVYTADRTFTLTVTETSYDSINNTSNISWTLSASGSSEWYTTYLRAVVNGEEVFNQKHNYDYGAFPVAIGSTEDTINNIKHNADGTKSISIYIEGYALGSPSLSKSDTLKLTDIDRTLPIISVSASNPGTNTVDLSATSNVVCDSWQYRLKDGAWGAWTDFKNVSETKNVNETISGLLTNTEYTVEVQARNVSNHQGGTASTSFKTIGGIVHIKIGGVWKEAEPFIKINGVWKRALAYVKNNNTWHIGV